MDIKAINIVYTAHLTRPFTHLNTKERSCETMITVPYPHITVLIESMSGSISRCSYTHTKCIMRYRGIGVKDISCMRLLKSANTEQSY